MISLSEYLEEGLLSGYDQIESDYLSSYSKVIERFIKTNYRIKGVTKGGVLQITENPNEKGKFIVNCSVDVEVKKENITSLTNGMFEWGEVGGTFNCSLCKSLTSLEGAPKKVCMNFICDHCNSLTSLEGAPEEVGGSIMCRFCESLKTLKGAPKEIGGSFFCGGCESLKNLEGAPKKINGCFYCNSCTSLTSLKGVTEIVGDFDCGDCRSLKSLEGAPKVAQGNFRCDECGKKFTEEDVRKVCKVGYDINC